MSRHQDRVGLGAASRQGQAWSGVTTSVRPVCDRRVLSQQRILYRDRLYNVFCRDKLLEESYHNRVCTALCHDKVSCVVTGRGAGRAKRQRAACARQRIVSVHCACDRPATVHYVVHCVGHCTWTLFIGIVQKKKRSTKMTPGNWGVTYIPCSFSKTWLKV